MALVQPSHRVVQLALYWGPVCQKTFRKRIISSILMSKMLMHLVLMDKDSNI